ncbi:hypothetical protein [Salisaeta icosahedral phage 1]|uniref:hypothetical protein n=1 Tax=Salisaeta icosahedral phage 1 TaxID=1183239 RepID=UPI00025EA91B|nr:hypothetical protein A322_gp14 [Salisaeta icosahedral phage 1]AFJ21469.1 hypothetical protein [Salisaeta icosahedral phage 1]
MMRFESTGAFEQQVAERVAEQLQDEMRALVVEYMMELSTVRGVDPHRLYTVSWVAKRLSLAKSTVYRKCEDGTLPTASWKGNGVRIRGIEVLRYEGALDDLPMPEPFCRSASTSHDASDDARQDDPARGNAQRPYNQRLPDL